MTNYTDKLSGRGSSSFVQTRGFSPRRLAVVALAALVSSVGFGLAAPASSLAAFTRPFVRGVTSAPTGPGGAAQPLQPPLALALDGAGNLWTSEFSGESTAPPYRLSEFAQPEDSFAKSLLVEGLMPPSEGLVQPRSMAIDDTTGTFYLAGIPQTADVSSSVEVFDSAGTYLRRWAVNRNSHVAVDNSGGPDGGDVYVAEASSARVVVSRYLPNGEAAGFTGSGPCISGNEIRGVPSAGGSSCTAFSEPESLQGIAVDGEGDVFVADRTYSGEASAVLEYQPSGAFVRAFVGTTSPGIGESVLHGGFGGQLEGVTVDPVSRHLLVAVTAVNLVGGLAVPIAGVVDEFDVASGAYLNQISQTANTAGEASPLRSAEDLTSDASGDIYVADPVAGAVDVFGPGHFLPTVKIEPPTQRTPSSVVLHGRVNAEAASNPEHSGLTSCDFEYVDQASFEASGFAAAMHASCEPAAGAIPADSADHQVQAEIGGLVSGETYRYRLAATTAGALGGPAASGSAAFTAPHAPSVGATTASDVSSAFAALAARINPLGASTSYRFEYDTRPYSSEEAHGLSVPIPDASIGAGGSTGSASERVSQRVGGLQAGTTYYFRAVAQNEAGVSFGAEATFTTQPQVQAGLPDGRAYELVTPASKLGGSDMFGQALTDDEYTNADIGTPDEAGDGLIFWTHAAFGPFPGNEASAYVFKRDAHGWQATSLTSPTLGVQNISDDFVFDPRDLSSVGVNDEVGSIASEAGPRRNLLIGAPGGPYSAIAVGPVSRDTTEARLRIAGASRDLGRSVIESPSHTLCAGAEGVKHGETLCEWDGAAFKLVNANNEGELLGTCGAVLGAGDAQAGGLSHDAVSTDGSRVLFTSPEPSKHLTGAGPGCWGGENIGGREVSPPQLYLHSSGMTLEVSAPQPGVTDPTGAHYAAYVGASEDDSRIFFLSEGWLTSDHPSGHDLELYECEVVTGEGGGPACELRRVSAGEAGLSGGSEGAGLYTVPAISAQGRVVYFTASGELAAGATRQSTPRGDSPVNLYRYDTATRATTYVSTVSAADSSQDDITCEFGAFGGRGVRGQCSAANWYTTPDGRYLVFSSWRELTGDNTTGPCRLPSSVIAPNGHCDEVYRYDSVSGSLTCVSCNPNGTPPTSNAEFARSQPGEPGSAPVAAISNDGAYVFFDTADPLVPADSNGTLDVYEWHDGRISLLSSGKDAGPSFFLGMSSVQTPSGPLEAANVFIGTHSQLLAEDADSNGDIYDARICTTESPCIQPAAGGTAQCEGDACQTPPASPLDATPTSATFSGAGNPLAQAIAPATVVPKKKLTNAQRLAAALKQCHKKRGKARRTCEAQARKRFAKKRVKGHGKPHTNNQGGRKGR